jgi:hypothetical protein
MKIDIAARFRVNDKVRRRGREAGGSGGVGMEAVPRGKVVRFTLL